MRIGILTGGGDVPGLNTVIRDVTYRAAREKDIEVIGIRRGWGGLIYMDPGNPEMDPEHAVLLNEGLVRTVDREGGTFLKTSRTLPSEVKFNKDLKDFRNFDKFDGKINMNEDVIRSLNKLKIDKLIAIGGDDTLSYALYLHNQGFPIIGIPKTMDGDVAGTDYCIGFSTAIFLSNQAITNLRSHLGSHERIGVVELFGRSSGLTGLYTALAAKPDRLIIPEVEFDMEKLASLLMGDRRKNPSNYSLVVVSEAAKPIGGREIVKSNRVDAYGNPKLGGIGEWIGDKLEEMTGVGISVENLRYSLRSGSPTAKDKLAPSIFANIAMDAVLRSQGGVMTAVRNGRYCLVHLEETDASPIHVDVARQYNVERYRPNYNGLEGQVVLL